MYIIKLTVGFRKSGKTHIYCEKDSEVNIVSVHGDVLILENVKTKERFSSRSENVLEIVTQTQIIDFSVKTEFEEKPKFIKFEEPIKKKKENPKNNQLSLL